MTGWSGSAPGSTRPLASARVISRLTADTTLLQTVVDTTASVALRNLLMLAGGTAMLIVTSPKLTGLVVLVVPLVVLPIVVLGRKVRRLSRASQDRIAGVAAFADETLSSIRTVQAFAHEDLERRRFGELAEAVFATAVSRIGARALLTAIVISLVFGAISAILWIGGGDVLAGRISGWPIPRLPVLRHRRRRRGRGRSARCWATCSAAPAPWSGWSSS